MLPKPLALAATAVAFVIVPEISKGDSEIFDGIVTALPIKPESFGLADSLQAQKVSVPCPQCKGCDSHLELDFNIEGSRLVLNGFELYPNADPWGGDLTATLVKENGKEKDKRLGYSLAVEPTAMDAYQQMQLINVKLSVIEVGGRFVEGVPLVKVQIIRAITEDLAIASVDVEQPSDPKCATMWCRLQDMSLEFSKAFKSLKGCVGRHQAKHPYPFGQAQNEGAGSPLAHGERPGHEWEHPHGHRHNWPLLIKNVASQIFLPVLMGITAGVGVAIVVMVICSIAIRFARLVRNKRFKKAGMCHKHSSRHAATADIEKVGLIEQADAEDVPPEYRDDESNN